MNPATVAKVTEGRKKEENKLHLLKRTAARTLEEAAVDAADPAEPTSSRRFGNKLTWARKTIGGKNHD